MREDPRWVQGCQAGCRVDLEGKGQSRRARLSATPGGVGDARGHRVEQAIVKGIFEASAAVVRLLLRSTAGPGLPLVQSYFVRLVESAEVSGRQEIAPSLKDAGWTCNRCEAENLALRDKCYKCSGPISAFAGLKGAREALRASGDSIPQRTVKRGGTKRKRAGQSRAAESSAGAASSSAAGPPGGKGGSRGDPVASTDHAVLESDDREWSWYGWQDRDRWDEWDWRYGDHREWEDRRGDRQGRDDYYED